VGGGGQLGEAGREDGVFGRFGTNLPLGDHCLGEAFDQRLVVGGLFESAASCLMAIAAMANFGIGDA
jgi:hypothetical protein